MLRNDMNAFIVSRFSYFSIFWMFHDRSANWKISKNPRESAQKCMSTGIYKAQWNLNSSFMNQTFVDKDMPCTQRSGRNTSGSKPNTTGYGIEIARFFLNLKYGMYCHLS